MIHAELSSIPPAVLTFCLTIVQGKILYEKNGRWFTVDVSKAIEDAERFRCSSGSRQVKHS